MENVNFNNEKLYLLTMSVIKSLLKKGLVSNQEYIEIDKMFQEKYSTVFGYLFMEVD